MINSRLKNNLNSIFWYYKACSLVIIPWGKSLPGIKCRDTVDQEKQQTVEAIKKTCIVGFSATFGESRLILYNS